MIYRNDFVNFKPFKSFADKRKQMKINFILRKYR